MKLPHQSTPPPVDDLDSSNKDHAESAGGGGPATQLNETGGPTTLDIAAIADGEVLVRSGATVTSQAASAPGVHDLGGAAHNAATLAELNAKVSDATLIDTGDSRLSDARTPTSHALGGAEHAADTLADLNTKVSDATLDGVDDPRPADEIITTTGPTTLAVGAVADGQYLKRSGSTVVGDTPGGGGAADALSTTGADVNVSGAAPPTTGQVLKATGATTATWQDESGGGSSVSAQGDYLHAELSADQSAPGVGTAIAYSVTVESRGDLSVDGAGKVSGFKAGRTYLIFPVVRPVDTTAARLAYQLYDVTATANLGNIFYPTYTQNYSTNSGASPVSPYPYTPTVDSEIEVRVSAVDGTPDVAQQGTSLTIVEIGATSNVVGETILESASNTISVTGLDGDAHGVYEVEWNLLLSDTGDPLVTAEPNGVATNQYGVYAGNFGTATGYTYWRIGAKAGETSRKASGTARLMAARTQGGVSVRRTFITDCGMTFDASPYGIFQKFHGYWTDTANNLTSLDIVTSITNGFLAGSRVTVRKA